MLVAASCMAPLRRPPTQHTPPGQGTAWLLCVFNIHIHLTFILPSKVGIQVLLGPHHLLEEDVVWLELDDELLQAC